MNFGYHHMVPSFPIKQDVVDLWIQLWKLAEVMILLYQLRSDNYSTHLQYSHCTNQVRLQRRCLAYIGMVDYQAAVPARYQFSQFSSVAQSCLTLCDPMNCSTPGLPVHHKLPESTQTHVHRVGDATQPSRPLLSPSLPAHNPSQHQGLFQ